MTSFTSGAVLTAAQLNSLQLLFRGRLSGLVPSFGDGAGGGDAANDLTFSAGVARDAANTGNILASSSLTKRLDAAWEAGTGNGGRAGNAAAWANAEADDWHCFLIGQSADETAFDIIVDDDAAGANIAAAVPAAWDLRRRVFSFRSGSSGELPAFFARELAGGGLEVLLSVPELEVDFTWPEGPDDGEHFATLELVPGGIQVNALIHAVLSDPSAEAHSAMLLTALEQNNTAAQSQLSSDGLGQLSLYGEDAGTETRGSIRMPIRTSTARSFRYRASNSTASHTFQVVTEGWIDERTV